MATSFVDFSYNSGTKTATALGARTTITSNYTALTINKSNDKA